MDGIRHAQVLRALLRVLVALESPTSTWQLVEPFYLELLECAYETSLPLEAPVGRALREPLTFNTEEDVQNLIISLEMAFRLQLSQIPTDTATLDAHQLADFVLGYRLVHLDPQVYETDAKCSNSSTCRKLAVGMLRICKRTHSTTWDKTNNQKSCQWGSHPARCSIDGDGFSHLSECLSMTKIRSIIEFSTINKPTLRRTLDSCTERVRMMMGKHWPTAA